MSIAYFLTTDDGAFAEGLMPRLVERPEVIAASLFTPDQAEDPYVDDKAPPALMLEIDVADTDALDAVFNDAAIRASIEAAGPSAKADAFEALAFPIEGVDDPAIRTAPMSFVVRYYGPVTDEKLFVQYYLDKHPPILAEMPGIRNVFCYRPVPWSNPIQIPMSGCILGNEVVFDNLGDLNAALASEVRHRLREDYNSFPVLPGPNTHYAMQRMDFRRQAGFRPILDS
ncbi:MAG: hypothetical protein QGH73_07265 [Rhodospirillales bacterium]|jgi:hypothetical protein|nr:hypothetical protein [Rhodospirillaceae bacterium]MDP6428204.1 hypothetical protein [Rhodospirillales bacterium]MDP6642913.1 hypothetical protein [Rhodospirillales bacterium]MDP6841460.1 hypothetical protein [Rhodospirillales bacterium]